MLVYYGGSTKMKLLSDSTPFLLYLLLLAELFVLSSSRPAHALCHRFRSMRSDANMLMNISKNLHHLTDDKLIEMISEEKRLQDLPTIHHSAGSFNTLKVNETLSQMLLYAESFKLHVDWLKTAKENVSLPTQTAEGASALLQHLSGLINASLHQVSQGVPQAPSPSLPVASTAFDVLQFSVEISEHLKVFCSWTKRVLLSLQKLSNCPKH